MYIYILEDTAKPGDISEKFIRAPLGDFIAILCFSMETFLFLRDKKSSQQS